MKSLTDLNNKYRVLLTEVLPYELPLLLNNEGFYRNMQDEKLRGLFVNVFSGGVKQGCWTIPFDYDVRRVGGERSRKMSLMHPLSQLDCVELYAKYDDYMLSLCAQSPYSIRYINKKAKCVFLQMDEDETGTDDLQERSVEMAKNEAENFYRSYFSYKKYDLVYKFFESGDNLRLEQKYPLMMVIDITGCFYHIYTHSLAWAVKGKTVAKDNVGRDSFESAFDKLMQHTNYNETNGIIVGPEISRIFAEIIMQAIDIAVLGLLKKKGYSLGLDYEIRRYVDDSYVYARSRDILDDIKSAYVEQLSFYKLDINKSKLEFFRRPFTSGVSDAKRMVNKMLAEFKGEYLNMGNDGNYAKDIKKDMSVFSRFSKQFRSITHQFNLEYGALNKYTLSLLLRQIRSEMMRVPSQGLLVTYADIAFFIFSLDMHTTASYRLCSILECLVRWSDKNQDVMVKQELMNRIRREAKRVMDIYQADLPETTTNMEALNLLTTLNRLIGFKIPVSQIEKIFRIDVKDAKGYAKLNYFQICTLLYIIEKDPTYDYIRRGIEQDVERRLSSPEVLRQAEMAYLLFDLMTCPYVKKSTCNKVLIQCCMVSVGNAGKKRAEMAKPGRWFFDWDKGHSLAEFLRKKEYNSPYE